MGGGWTGFWGASSGLCVCGLCVSVYGRLQWLVNLVLCVYFCVLSHNTFSHPSHPRPYLHTCSHTTHPTHHPSRRCKFKPGMP